MDNLTIGDDNVQYDGPSGGRVFVSFGSSGIDRSGESNTTLISDGDGTDDLVVYQGEERGCCEHEESGMCDLL